MGVAIAPTRRALLQAGNGSYIWRSCAPIANREIAPFDAETQAATAARFSMFDMYRFRPALIACVRGAWRVMRSRRVAAQMRGEFPQIDRICITIAGIGMAKFV